MTKRDDLRVAKALQGADFPAGRETLLDYARTRDTAAETMQALSTIPERSYGSVEEVTDAVAQEPEREP